MPRSRLLQAFRVRSYRWLWLGGFAHASAFTTFSIGQGWVLLQLSGSPLIVGLGPGLFGVGSLLSSVFAGLLIDRLDRRNILIAAQGSFGLAISALGILIVTHHIQVWHILLASSLNGLIWGIQWPARNTLLYDLVGREILISALAGQFLTFHLSSVLGPLGAGFVLDLFGAGTLFLVVSVWLLLGTLLLFKVPSVTQTARPVGSAWLNWKEGVGYAWRDSSVRTVMLTILITEGLGFSSGSMFPVITRNTLHAGPIVLGLLSTFQGLGGIAGALVISSFSDIKAKGWVFIGASFAFGLSLFVFAFSRSLPLSLAILVLVGFSGVIYDTLASTLVQTLAPEAMRGRMMGVYSSVISGFSLGGLAMGSMARWLGVTWAIAGGGGVVGLNALSRIPSANTISRRSIASRLDQVRATQSLSTAKEHHKSG